MKWKEAREKYPNTWVLLKSVKEKINDDTKIIDDVDVIKVIPNNKEATKTLMECRGNTFVYHTSRDTIKIKIVNTPVLIGRK